ncbi:MAG: hypothetical protein JNJ57_18750 [Saprospiraceae bacterium]|nr:hypothetical protein [Saprospiraceae bacterium]
MKTVFLMLIALNIAFTSCQKDPADPNNNNNDDSFVEFKVDGQAYRVEGVLAYGTALSDQLGIYAVYNPDNSTKNDDRLLYILFDKTKDTGNILLKEEADDDFGVWIVGDGATDDKEFFTYNETAGGVLQLTQKTEDVLEGTFSFSAATFHNTHKVYITDGKFSVKMR